VALQKPMANGLWLWSSPMASGLPSVEVLVSGGWHWLHPQSAVGQDQSNNVVARG
jgi:hypothetical protein